MASRIAVAVLNLVLLGAFCCFSNSVGVSIAVLKTTAVIISRNIQLIVLPFCAMFTMLIWTVFWWSNFQHMSSTGKVTQPTDGSQWRDVEYTGN